MQITYDLAAAGKAQIFAVEPNIQTLPLKLQNMKNVSLMEYHEAINKADIVLLLVDHKEFKNLDKEMLKGKIIIDTRGIWA